VKNCVNAVGYQLLKSRLDELVNLYKILSEKPVRDVEDMKYFLLI